jgi:hypothetical protein
MPKSLFILLFPCCFLSCHSQQLDIEKIRKDVSYLAGDDLKGRATGSVEESVAAKYIAAAFRDMGLQPKGKDNTFFYPFIFKKVVNVHDTTQSSIPSSGINVIAYLDNAAPLTVIIGAHYDHLGLGMDENTLDPSEKGKVHNGADDNASGTAGVMALANYFSKNNRREKFNFLFICFSGEELGLIGSKKFCDDPTISLSTVNYMINLDMIGRMDKTSNKLIIYGVGTAKEWVPLIDQLPCDFEIRKDSSGIGPSDQTSFYLKNIPVLHFFTGQHNDYHKISDDFDKLNFEGEKRILQYIVQIVEKTEAFPKLRFLTTKNSLPEIRTFKVTMGVIPDYSFEGRGMRIDGILEGRSALKAGLQKGDVVIGMNEYIINNLNDYMKALYIFQKGQTIQLTIIRDKTELKLPLTFQ